MGRRLKLEILGSLPWSTARHSCVIFFERNNMMW